MCVSVDMDNWCERRREKGEVEIKQVNINVLQLGRSDQDEEIEKIL